MVYYEVVPHGGLFAVRVKDASEPISVHPTRDDAIEAKKRYEAADARRARKSA